MIASANANQWLSELLPAFQERRLGILAIRSWRFRERNRSRIKVGKVAR